MEASLVAGLRGDLHRRDHGQGSGRTRREPVVYAVIGVDLDERKDILGIWVGGNVDGESAKYWPKGGIGDDLRSGRNVFCAECPWRAFAVTSGG